MEFNQFKREVNATAQGQVSPAFAAVDRAMRKKELQRCALAWSQFAAGCLNVRDRDNRQQRLPLPSEHLPPVA